MRKQLNFPLLILVLLIAFLALGSHYWLSNFGSSLPRLEAKVSEPVKTLPDFTLFIDVQTKKEAFFEAFGRKPADHKLHQIFGVVITRF